MPHGVRVDDQLPLEPLRPQVMLALEDTALRARLAYELTAFGFNVALTDIEERRPLSDDDTPDVIIVHLSARPGSGYESGRPFRDAARFRGVPVVAVAADVDGATRDLARRLGCAAVCLSTCSGDVLARGVRAVLDRPGSVEGVATHCHVRAAR